MSARPLLLMDVDGPLNPFAAAWLRTGTGVPGFSLHRLRPFGEVAYQVALSPSHGQALRDLSERFDLVWATTWCEEANRLIAPLLGLPTDLPVIAMQPRPAGPDARCWKTDLIAEWVAGRSFVWFDDEINRATRNWLAAQPGIGRHLAHQVDPRVGLSMEDFAFFWDFAAQS